MCLDKDVFVYTCVRCGNTWTCSEEEKFRLIGGAHSNKDNKSGGVCPECYRGPLRGKIQNHQNKNYGHSCFLSISECENAVCCFNYVCRDSRFQAWERTKV